MGTQLPICGETVHLCNLPDISLGVVVGWGQICGQTTQGLRGDLCAPLCAQSERSELLETSWPQCSSCRGLAASACKLVARVSGLAKTMSVWLVQLSWWVSWCLAVLHKAPTARQQSLNPSRCFKWRGYVFVRTFTSQVEIGVNQNILQSDVDFISLLLFKSFYPPPLPPPPSPSPPNSIRNLLLKIQSPIT